MYDILSLGEMLLPELRKIAEKFEIPHKGLKKQDLAYKILDYQGETFFDGLQATRGR